MTMVSMYKTCPKCHKKYSWKSDVGKLFCSHCGVVGKPKKGVLESLFEN